MTIQDLFRLGMKRDLPNLQPLGKVVVNLGAGSNLIPHAYNYDFPDWNAETDRIRHQTETVDSVLAFHLIEHLTGHHAIGLLREIERVLKPNGVAYIVVPHSAHGLAFEDLDHKSYYTEDTLKTLFKNAYYEKHREVAWRLSVEMSLIMGVAIRNLSIFYVLRKDFKK